MVAAMEGLQGALTLVIGAIFTYLASITFYNVYLHPLARFPGPKLWAVSRLPFVLAMRSGDLVHRIQSFHETYGSVVRLAPNEVSFTDPQACRDIYTHRSGHLPFPKNQIWIPTPPKNSGKASSILNANDEDHARIRKAWSYGFSDRALKDQEPLITSHVDKLISRLRQQCQSQERGAVLNIVKWYNFCVFDVIGDLAFGESFGCLDRQDYHSWVATIIHHFKYVVLMSACRYYPLLYRLLVWSVPKSSVQKQAQHDSMVREKVQSRLCREKEHPDFLSHLAKARASLSDAEIESTAGTIIIAGSNSLTTTLAGTTNYLLRSPAALAKVTREIRSTFNNEDEMNLTNLGQLSYLTAVIQEGLRIIAPVPLGMPRVVPKGGDTICGQWFPQDTYVSFMQYGASRSKENFAQPHEFIPERWLDIGKLPSSPFVKDRADALQPFSLGPRSCIGQNLAYFELRLILARMLFNFDIDLPNGPHSGLLWTSQKTYATWVKDPFIVRLIPVSTRL